MANVEFDIREFESFCNKVLELDGKADTTRVLEAGTNQLAALYVREAKKRTPVGKRGSVKAFMGRDKNGKAIYLTYHYNTQQTRNAWRVNSAKVVGTTAFARVYNLSKYASFLNDGHRQEVGRYVPMLGTPIGGVVHGARLKKPWVEGLHMTDAAESVVDRNAGRILDRVVRGYLRELNK
jgi:hypothetical protein